MKMRVTIAGAILAATLTCSPVNAAPANDEVEVYPTAFRGAWAPSVASCKDETGEEVITIGTTKIRGYESDSKLLTLTPEIYSSAPSGAEAITVNALVAERGESEVAIGKLRLTLSAGKLYTSRLDAVSEDTQWKYPNVRCPKLSPKSVR